MYKPKVRQWNRVTNRDSHAKSNQINVINYSVISRWGWSNRLHNHGTGATRCDGPRPVGCEAYHNFKGNIMEVRTRGCLVGNIGTGICVSIAAANIWKIGMRTESYGKIFLVLLYFGRSRNSRRRTLFDTALYFHLQCCKKRHKTEGNLWVP